MRKLGSRKEELKKVIRYGTKGEWSPMFYRPDLLIHTTRVYWITREICNYLRTLKPEIFDYEKTLEFAKFHDDGEILAGDIISLNKESFSDKQKEEYEKKTLEAIDELAKIYSNETLQDYKELLLIDFHKIGTEYVIGMYADKFDAHMEVCHELFAGSPLFFQPLTRWNLPYNSFEYTRKKVTTLLRQLEDIFGVTLEDTLPFFSLPEIDVQNFLEKGKAHSEASLKKDIGYLPYDERKKLHFLSGNSREKEYLWNQKEFT